MMKNIRFLLGISVWLYGTYILAQPGVEAGEAIGPSGPHAVELLLRAVFSMILGSFIIARNYPEIEPFQRYPVFLLALAIFGVSVASMGGSVWLDDDLYRYVWDGALSAQGISPHTISPELAPGGLVGPEIFQGISYKSMPSIYPPMATWWFEAVYRVWGENLGYWLQMNVVLTVIGLGLTLRLCYTAGAPRWLAILVLLNPLWAKEFGDSGHIDILAYDLVLISMLGARYLRGNVSRLAYGLVMLLGVNLGLAIMIKPLALIWLLFFPSMVIWQRLWLGAGAAISVLLSCYFYFESVADLGLYLNRLAVFAKYWIFNPGLADLVRGVLAIFTTSDMDENWLAAGRITKSLAYVVLLGGWAWFLRDMRGRRGEIRLWTMGIFLSLMPAFNPW
jgi:hypothetical protein